MRRDTLPNQTYWKQASERDTKEFFRELGRRLSDEMARRSLSPTALGKMAHLHGTTIVLMTRGEVNAIHLYILCFRLLQLRILPSLVNIS